MIKFILFLLASIAVLFLLATVGVTHFHIFDTGLSVISVVIFIIIAAIFLYPILHNLGGIDISRKSWAVRLKMSHGTPISEFALFLTYLSRWAYLGFRSFSEFRTELAGVSSPLLRRDVFAIFATLACYNFGLLNLIFPIIFWNLISVQFEDDFDAAVHVSACETIIGVFFIATKLLHLGAFVYALYPLFSIAWIAMYSRELVHSNRLLVLQFLKLLTFIGSIVIPYLILSRYSFPF